MDYQLRAVLCRWVSGGGTALIHGQGYADPAGEPEIGGYPATGDADRFGIETIDLSGDPEILD
jgi:hypothetical protein